MQYKIVQAFNAGQKFHDIAKLYHISSAEVVEVVFASREMTLDIMA